MTQEAHTPEPWVVDGSLQIRAPDIFDDGTIAEDWVVAQVDVGCGYPDCHDKANARRIVACVNALAGIPIETIEALPEGELARLITRTPDSVIAELVEAAQEPKADLLERAEWDGDVRVVCAGAGAWARFCNALAKWRQANE